MKRLEGGSDSRSTARLSPLAALAALAILTLGLYQNREFFHDDAYIALRYARNLLEGHGLTWNPGERVEGYTSFLHVLLTAGAGWLGLSLPHAARLVNLAALGGLILATWAAAASFCARGHSEVTADDSICCTGPSGGAAGGRSSLLDPGPLSALLLVSGSYPLITWSLGGLEVPLQALFLALGCWQTGCLLLGETATSRAWTAGVAFGLAVLARPDSLLLAGMAGAFLLLPPRAPGRLRTSWVFVASCFGVVLPHAIWRRAYYGDWLPNPFYAKATGLPTEYFVGGKGYLLDYLWTPPFLLLLATAACATGLLRRGLRLRVAYLASSLLAYVLYIVQVGGDHMPVHRLFAPVVPYASLLVAVGLSASPPAIRARRLAWFSGLLGLSVLQAWRPGGQPIDPAARDGRIVAEYIRESWPPGSLVALNTAGSTPFFAPDHRYLDMLGLNDPHIARVSVPRLLSPFQAWPGHAKGDGAYVLARRPDYIILGPAFGWPLSHAIFRSGMELASLEAFRRCYVERRVKVPAGADTEKTFLYYQRLAAEGEDCQAVP